GPAFNPQQRATTKTGSAPISRSGSSSGWIEKNQLKAAVATSLSTLAKAVIVGMVSSSAQRGASRHEFAGSHATAGLDSRYHFGRGRSLFLEFGFAHERNRRTWEVFIAECGAASGASVSHSG
ncbi:MAG: hypothetical protein ACRETY_15290, partial [Steroidobacteraceae bacterium]